MCRSPTMVSSALRPYDDRTHTLPTQPEKIMGRPPLDIGEHGEIRTYCQPATDTKLERWRAVTNYRGTDGKTTRQGMLVQSPVTALSRTKSDSKKSPRAMTVEQVAEFLAAVDADKVSVRADLPDLLRFMLGTGVRLGEALAVRWRDVNLSDKPMRVVDPAAGEQVVSPRSVWVNGNLVYVVGKGIVRHDGKTESSVGVVGLPGFLFTLLVVRKPADATPDEPVFPGARLGWRRPRCVMTSMQRMRARTSPEDAPDRWA